MCLSGDDRWAEMIEVREGDKPISRGGASQARGTVSAKALRSGVAGSQETGRRIVGKEAREVARLYSIPAKWSFLSSLAHLKGWGTYLHPY